jgi:ribosomal protein S6--L-glutamate ligase
MDADGATVAFLTDRRHLGNPVLLEAGDALKQAGCRVEVIVPGADHLYLVPAERPPWDAAVARGRDLAGLGLLAAAAALGVLAINRPAAIELVRNKIAMQAVLRYHRLPLPRTWFAADPEVFRAIPADSFPLVVKPFDGDGALGLALLTDPADIDLLSLDGAGRLYLAQELLETDGTDLKLYGVGSHIWAVRKPSPVHFDGPGPAVISPTDGAEIAQLDRELRDIALTCGRACGLELWGVDVAMTPAGPRIIEVNDFPTYSGVSGAGEMIARHILAAVAIDRLTREVGRDHLRAAVRDS